MSHPRQPWKKSEKLVILGSFLLITAILIWATWRVRPGVVEFKAGDTVDMVTFSPDGKRLAVTLINEIGLTHTRVELRDAQTGALQRTLITNPVPGYMSWPAWSRDGQMIASAAQNYGASPTSSTIYLWNAETGQLIWRRPSGPPQEKCWISDLWMDQPSVRLIAIGDKPALYDLANGGRIFTFPSDHEHSSCPWLTHNKDYLYSVPEQAFKDKRGRRFEPHFLTLFDARTGQPVRQLDGKETCLSSYSNFDGTFGQLLWSRDGNQNRGVLRIWDAKLRRVVWTMPNRYVGEFSFAPTAPWLVRVLDLGNKGRKPEIFFGDVTGGHVEAWNYRTHQLKWARALDGRLCYLAFGSKGRHLVAIETLPGPLVNGMKSQRIHCLNSQDGKTIRSWDIASNNPIADIAPSEDAVVFSDGKKLEIHRVKD